MHPFRTRSEFSPQPRKHRVSGIIGVPQEPPITETCHQNSVNQDQVILQAGTNTACHTVLWTVPQRLRYLGDPGHSIHRSCHPLNAIFLLLHHLELRSSNVGEAIGLQSLCTVGELSMEITRSLEFQPGKHIC